MKIPQSKIHNPTTFLWDPKGADRQTDKICRVARPDAWMPRYYKGRPLWFVLHDCGAGHYVMRLFLNYDGCAYWLRRNTKWRGANVHSHGRITFK